MPEHLTVFTIASHAGDPRCYLRALPESGGYEEIGCFVGENRTAEARIVADHVYGRWEGFDYIPPIELTEGEFGRVMMRRMEVLV